MTPDVLFQAANMVALCGWVLLALAPLAPVWSDRIAGFGLPAGLSLLYSGLILAFWAGADGGFDTLAGVQSLLLTPEIALAGWVHYLAFDLFLGGWELRRARRLAIPHVLMVPILALTFLFGPAGFAAFLALAAAWRPHAPQEIRP
jgi:hypothetical protein